MNKLLCVLMLGLMFGQTKLETRVYEFSDGVYEQEYQVFSLSEITNNELSDDNFAIIDIFGYSEDSYLDGNCYLHIKKEYGNEDTERSFVNFQYGLNTIHIEWKEEIIYEPTLNHSIKAVGGSFIGTLRFAITAEFPDDDTSLEGDLNDDDIVNVLDIVALVGIVLGTDTGNIDVDGLIESVRG